METETMSLSVRACLQGFKESPTACVRNVVAVMTGAEIALEARLRHILAEDKLKLLLTELARLKMPVSAKSLRTMTFRGLVSRMSSSHK